MPIINGDDFSYIEYFDTDFTFTADTAPSEINPEACLLIVDEIEAAAYILSQFAFNVGAVNLESVSLPLKISSDADLGVKNKPFLLDAEADGLCNVGKCMFQDGQNGSTVLGAAYLEKVSGIWRIRLVPDSMCNCDRFTIELNYQIDLR